MTLQLTQITARYLRRKQPQQFEPAEAEVSVTFTATEGNVITFEKAEAYYDKALTSVQAVVMAKMKGVPNPVVVAPEGLTAVAAEAKAAPVAAPVAEAPKNKGGRPRKDAAPAAPKSEPVNKPAAVATDEFGDPIKPAAKPAAAAADEFDENPADAAAADAGDDEFAENEVKPMTAVELQQTLSGLVTGKKVAGSDVKAILAKYGLTRSADAAEADRAKILAEVKALIKVAK